MTLLSSNVAAAPAEAFVALRGQIPLLRSVAYFQTGSLAPLANVVRDAAVLALEAEGTSALEGPDAYAAFHRHAESQRNRLASFLGADPAEIGWTASTTTAIRHAIDCLDWHPGDTLLTTNREHISTRALQAGLQQHRGVQTTIVDAGSGDDRLLSEIEQALQTTRSKRLLLVSHVSCQDGTVLPVAEAVRLAHAFDTPVLVDGAQSIGQIPVDLSTLECDLLVGSSHKWLLGPAGLGFLYVSQQGRAQFRAPFALSPSPEGGNQGSAEPVRVAQGVELGTASLASRAGLAAAVEMLDTIGIENIQSHIAQLTDLLRNELAALPTVLLYSSGPSASHSGITSIGITGRNHADLTSIVSRMWESNRVVAKVQVEQPSIRISIAPFNNEADVFLLISALRDALAVHDLR